MSSKIRNSLISLFALFMVALGFQNMAWLATPSPEAKYFPKDINETTAEGVGRALLRHNLAPIEGVLKERLDVWKSNHSVSLSSSSGEHDLSAEYTGNMDSENSKASWVLGLTSASKYRVAYKGSLDLTCDVSMADQSYKLSIKRSISSNSDVRLEHDSKYRDSSVKMQISW